MTSSIYGKSDNTYFVAPSELIDDTTSGLTDVSVYVKGNIAIDGNSIKFSTGGTSATLEWDGSNFSFDGSTIGDLSGASSLLELSDVGIDSALEPENNDVLVYDSVTSLWEPIQLNLEQLGNVSSASPSSGQILKWNAGTSQWEPASETLVDPGDSAGVFLTAISITTASASSGGSLSYDDAGTFTFAPADLSSLDNITDVNVPAPSDGEVLKWDSGTSKWISGTVTGTGNVLKPTLTSGNDNHIVVFDNDTGSLLRRDGMSISGSELITTISLNVDNSNGITTSGPLFFLQDESGIDVGFTKQSDSIIRFGENVGGVAGEGFFFDIDNSSLNIWGNLIVGSGVSGVKSVTVKDWLYATSDSDPTAVAIYRSGYGGNATSFYQEGDILVRGVCYANGGFVNSSDERLKENILSLEDSLVKVKQLQGVSYNFISDEDKKPQIGLIAQDVQKVIPEVVEEGKDGYLGINYGNLVAHLIEAIKTQDKRIEELERKLESYK